MQMRGQYTTIDHHKRAAQLRKSARELHLAGFDMFADLAWEEAEILQPSPKREETKAKGKRGRA